MSIFYKEVDKVIKREGGYSDNPHDSGGKTNYGITEAVAREWGYEGHMKDLPESVAVEIYKANYWNPLMLDDINEISEEIAAEMFDTAVNAGIYTAATYLQRGLNLLNRRSTLYSNIVVDGVIGTKTFDAFKDLRKRRGAKGIKALFIILDTLQGAKYINLAEKREKDEEFIMGWVLNRLRG